MSTNNPSSQHACAISTAISPNDIFVGLQPAYRHIRTGESHLAQTPEGVPTTDYGFAGLPDEWVVERDNHGNPLALHPDVVAGYWRNARFIALSQLSKLPLDG